MERTMTTSAPAADTRAQTALLLAWGTALVATLGALFVGEVLGQTPCLLCWYQRIAMFPLAWILGVACFQGDLGVRPYALPLALVGGAIAAYHSGLYLGLIPAPITPCTSTGPSCTDANMTILGTVPLPVLSLLAFLIIAVCLALTGAQRTETPR